MEGCKEGKECLPVFIPVHVAWHHIVDVGACADEEEDYEEEGLEVEERGLECG